VAWAQRRNSRGGQLGIYVIKVLANIKKIEAIIYPVHVNAVRAELERHGIRSGLTLIEVRYGDGDRSLLQLKKGDSKNST
jgi:hypothetical protein